MECAKCGQPISDGESCEHFGSVLCEDCYIQAIEPLRTCDVAAVHSAKTHRAAAGQTGTDGLTALQKSIYEYVVAQGRATKPALSEAFGLTALEVDRQMTIMRHCELLKGRKIDDVIYMVPFDLE
ncbi:MAG: hypothetical protein H6Q00_1444 [Holophagaceae bacterium]|nr:hypothetical protein [Holophagaceae bacterium]